jgi:hypothetical protein
METGDGKAHLQISIALSPWRYRKFSNLVQKKDGQDGDGRCFNLSSPLGRHRVIGRGDYRYLLC